MMKGYNTDSGYKGCIDGRNDYRMFSDEGEYIEYVEESEKESTEHKGEDD